MKKKIIRELILGIAGAAYLALVFLKNIYSPAIGLALASLTAYDLVDSHRRDRKGASSPTTPAQQSPVLPDRDRISLRTSYRTPS